MRPWCVAGLVTGALLSVNCTRGTPPTIAVERAWARPADSGATTAVYLVIVNHDTAAVTLTGMTSPLAEAVGLHETMKMGDMVHMMPLDGPQPIAPGDSLVLHEGEKHLMVSGLIRKLAAGDSLPLSIALRDGRVLHVAAQVRAP